MTGINSIVTESRWCFAVQDQVYHPFLWSELSISAHFLQSVRYRSTNVYTQDWDKVTWVAIFVWRQLRVVDQIVCDHVRFDQSILSLGDKTIRISWWADILNTIVHCVLFEVVQHRYAAIGQEHGHLNLLDVAITTFKLAARDHCNLVINHLCQLMDSISVLFVFCESQTLYLLRFWD